MCPLRRNIIRLSRVMLVVSLICAGVGAKLLWNSRPPQAVSTSTRSVAHKKSGAGLTPLSRRKPTHIRPSDDFGELFPEEDLRRFLIDMAPTWDTFKITRALHAFRLWGPDAVFPHAEFSSPFGTKVFSGRELQTLLLDQQSSRRLNPGGIPLLYSTRFGVGTVVDSSRHGNFSGVLAHYDDLLLACAIIGLGTDTRIRTKDAEATIGELVGDSVARFDSSQELEWTTAALALYLAPRRAWTNRYGVEFSFDDAAELLLKQTQRGSACLGIHVPYALVCLLRVDDQHAILDASSREEIRKYLRRISTFLVESQGHDGLWRVGISGERPESSTTFESLFLAVTSTGHHLEWIALAPRELRPPQKSVAKAAKGILRRVNFIIPEMRSELYCPLTHVARALCLLRGKSPTEMIGNSIQKAGRDAGREHIPEKGSVD